MAEEKQIPKEGVMQIERIYEQPLDTISFYSDMAQILATENEVIMQFYETIPGPPSIGGGITKVRSRLRATITISFPHARNIGKLLVERAGEVK